MCNAWLVGTCSPLYLPVLIFTRRVSGGVGELNDVSGSDVLVRGEAPLIEAFGVNVVRGATSSTPVRSIDSMLASAI